METILVNGVKFWKIKLNDNSVIISYGIIDSEDTLKIGSKPFLTKGEAEKYYYSKIGYMKDKGYILQGDTITSIQKNEKDIQSHESSSKKSIHIIKRQYHQIEKDPQLIFYEQNQYRMEKTNKEAKRFMEKFNGAYLTKEGIFYAICVKGSNTVSEYGQASSFKALHSTSHASNKKAIEYAELQTNEKIAEGYHRESEKFKDWYEANSQEDDSIEIVGTPVEQKQNIEEEKKGDSDDEYSAIIEDALNDIASRYPDQ